MFDREGFLARFASTRRATEAFAALLSAEDQQLQAFPDASPTKWHRAHTTWFWETFLLTPHGVPPADARYGFLFNSYYEGLGPRHARQARGILSRPSCDEITSWRRTVDGRVHEVLSGLSDEAWRAVAPLCALGVAHEEQHQELMRTDILAALSQNALQPAVSSSIAPPPPLPPASERVAFDGGLVTIGNDGTFGFAFDNEGPRHQVFLRPYALSSRPVTVGEVRAFIDAGGYQTASWWLSDGWALVQREGLRAPEYASVNDAPSGSLRVFDLGGLRVAASDEAASCLSAYEADAIARFLGGRLPTEAEWEHAATSTRGDRVTGAFADGVSDDDGALRGLFGTVWEWTQSAYAAYPGFRAPPGVVGEYNGKFMVNQLVLRGGSSLSNRGHLRASYRNFWPAATRFQRSGVRVAWDL